MASGDVTSYSDVAVRAATASVTADSATWSASESGALLTATGTVTAGQTYKIFFSGNVSTNATAASPGIEISIMRIREDTATGNQLDGKIFYVPTVAGNGYGGHLYAEWTASATGSKSFVVTGNRVTGSGTNSHQLRAGSNHPCILTVDRIVQ